MSQTRATGLRWKGKKTSSNSLCSFGPAWMTSFRVMLSHFATVPEGPTSWVSPLVVAPKPDGDVTMCIDMRCANQEIIREHQPIPTVNKVLQDWMAAQYLAVWTWSEDFVWYFLQRKVGMWQHLRLTAGFPDIPVSCFMFEVTPLPAPPPKKNQQTNHPGCIAYLWRGHQYCGWPSYSWKGYWAALWEVFCCAQLVKGGGFDIKWGQINVSPSYQGWHFLAIK